MDLSKWVGIKLDAEFLASVDKILGYILEYTDKSLDPKNDAEQLMHRSFEGFKLAQNEILERYLETESHIKESKRPEEIWLYKRDILRQLTDIIAFTIYGFEWTHFKPFIHKDMNHGFLEDRNIQSCIELSNIKNNEPGRFAFINDLSSAIAFGDITEVSFSKELGYKIRSIEVKVGKKNEELINKLLRRETLPPSAPQKDIAQLERISKEIKKMGRFTEYKMRDVLAIEGGGKRVAHDYKNRRYYTKEIRKALKKISETHIEYISTDFGVIQVSVGSGLTKKLDFKHYIHHTRGNDWGECEYIGKNIDDEALLKKEPMVYLGIPISNVMDSIIQPAVEPLSMHYQRKELMDLISGNVGIFTYFDVKVFLNTLEKNGLKTGWVKSKYLLKNLNYDQTHLRELVEVNHQYLSISLDNMGEAIFSYGFLFKMIYLHLSAETVAKMYKKMLKSFMLKTRLSQI